VAIRQICICPVCGYFLLADSNFGERGKTSKHRRMARGGHGLPKVSLGPTMPDPSTTCGRAIPEKGLQLFQLWPACLAGGLRPSSTPLGTSLRTPMPQGQFTDFFRSNNVPRSRCCLPGKNHIGKESNHTVVNFIFGCPAPSCNLRGIA
jgi:hypothetical protein